MINALMIGPDPESKGGIATVINNILNNREFLDDVSFTNWPSYSDGSLMRRACFSAMKEVDFRFLEHVYDVYHIHTASGTSFWRKRRYIEALGEDSQRAVLHIHSGGFVDFWDRCSSSQKSKVRTAFSKVGRVIALSANLARQYEECGICDGEKIEILPNAVDIPEHNLTDYAANTVLFMGRLDENKSPDVLIRAAAIVIASHPDARFVFAGDGDSSDYESLANELCIGDSCDFLGWVSGETKEELLLSSSIFCLPSRREALPMSILEAMSYGLAVVATNQGGIPSVVEDGVNGMLMEVGDYVGLAGILNVLMNNFEAKKALGESGRAHVRDSYGMSAYMRKLIKIYREVSL